MKPMFHSLSLLVLVASSSLAAPVESPKELAEAYFSLLKKSNWTETAELFDPTALKQFREMTAFLTELAVEEAEGHLRHFFGADATRESVREMSDAEYFSAFMQAVMGQAVQAGQLNFEKVEVIGAVAEGDDVRHVVARIYISVGELKVESMEVLTCNRTADGWKLALQGKMKGMAEQLKRALSP